MPLMPPVHALASEDQSLPSQAMFARRPLRRRARTLSSTASESEPVAMGAPQSQPMSDAPAARSSRRPTSYYNAFQTSCQPSHDEPPTYVTATARPLTQILNHVDARSESLPAYSCSLAVESKLLLSVESINPLNSAVEGDWKEVLVSVRGTLLNIHRLKDGVPVKLLRSYTLQHAEVGLAPDSRHTVLIPRTRLAQLIPTAARKRTWAKDPSLFHAVRQSILRLRVETDQILLADSSEERIHDMISAISAGIDIAHDLDERSLPRQCTMPRRRRRPRADFTGDLTDPALVADQERIMRTMFPALAEDVPVAQSEMPGSEPVEAETTPDATSPPPLGREEDDIDLTVVSESPSDSISTPETSSDSGVDSFQNDDSRYTEDMMYATASSNFSDETGKWSPNHPRTSSQRMRYIRRCMPVLPSDASRASDILISNSRRVKINWRMELLENWELAPPSYNAHGFVGSESAGGDPRLIRTVSHSSTAASASSADARGDDIDAISPPPSRPTSMLITPLSKMWKRSSRTESMMQKLFSEDGNLSAFPPTDSPTERPSGLAARNEISGLMYCF